MNPLPQGRNVPPPTRLDFRSRPVRFTSHTAPNPWPLCVLNSAFSIGSFSLAFKRAKIAFILNFPTLWSPLITNVSPILLIAKILSCTLSSHFTEIWLLSPWCQWNAFPAVHQWPSNITSRGYCAAFTLHSFSVVFLFSDPTCLG